MRLRIDIFCNALHMTSSRSQKTVPAMGAWIVWSEEDRTKGMVSRRFVRKGDRANFRLGYMGGCVKKNRNTKMVCAAEKGKVKYRLHPSIHTHLDFSLAQDIESSQG
ncbi:MAG: hypothetical protein ACR2PH_14710, partial [Desulfobulbia bacterium]